jgi:hypothetical protein
MRNKMANTIRITVNDLEVGFEFWIVAVSDQKTDNRQFQDDRFARTRRCRNDHVLVAVNQLD